jgi:hypothetical protein
MESFAATDRTGLEESRGILGENRALGFKALPDDAPEWVKSRVAEIRTARLEGREPQKFVPVRSSKFTEDAIAALAAAGV